MDRQRPRPTWPNVKVWTVTGVTGALLSICIASGVALVRSLFGN